MMLQMMPTMTIFMKLLLLSMMKMMIKIRLIFSFLSLHPAHHWLQNSMTKVSAEEEFDDARDDADDYNIDETAVAVS